MWKWKLTKDNKHSKEEFNIRLSYRIDLLECRTKVCDILKSGLTDFWISEENSKTFYSWKEFLDWVESGDIK